MKAVERDWTVADVMVEDVVTVQPDTPYKVLVEKLWLQGVSGLPVIDSQSKLVGIVSETDLMRKQEHGGGAKAMEMMRGLSLLMPELLSADAGALLTGLSKAVGQTAADLMTSPVITIGPEATLTAAAAAMHKRNLKRLPVVGQDGRLVGIMSRADLLKVFLRSDESIEIDVKEALRADLGDPHGVTAKVVNGVVTLEGEAPSPFESETLVRHIDRLPGVVGVEARLSPPM